MASDYFGLNVGQASEATQIGTATAGTDVEVRVDTSKVKSKLDLLLTLEKINQQIVKHNYPAA